MSPEISENLNRRLILLTNTRQFEHPEITDERIVGIKALLEQSQNTPIGREFIWRRLKLLVFAAKRSDKGRRIENQILEVTEPNIFTQPGAQAVETLIYRRIFRATLRFESRRRTISPIDSNALGLDLEGLTEHQFLEDLRNWPHQYFALFEAPIL